MVIVLSSCSKVLLLMTTLRPLIEQRAEIRSPEGVYLLTHVCRRRSVFLAKSKEAAEPTSQPLFWFHAIPRGLCFITSSGRGILYGHLSFPLSYIILGVVFPAPCVMTHRDSTLPEKEREKGEEGVEGAE